jgi:hypothetical protein
MASAAANAATEVGGKTQSGASTAKIIAAVEKTAGRAALPGRVGRHLINLKMLTITNPRARAVDRPLGSETALISENLPIKNLPT